MGRKKVEPIVEPILEPIRSAQTLENIIGCSNIQEEVKRYAVFLKNPEKFQSLNVTVGRGCLLVGPIGSGKRTIAHAVAGEAKVNLFEISDLLPDVESAFGYKLLCNGKKVGVEHFFDACRKHTPCVVFINHLDIIKDTCNDIVMMFLHEMEKSTVNDGIIFFAAACEEADIFGEKLFCRSGRFTHQVKFLSPNFQERKEIFTFLLRDVKHDNTIDVDILARQTEGAEIGEIKELLNTCMIRLVTRNRSVISLEDIEELIDDFVLGYGDKKFAADKESLKATAYHETGHALVMYYGDDQGFDPLFKVTIVKREGSLGLTFGLQEGKQKDHTKQRILQMIDVAFGGLVAEELLYGRDNITTGVEIDLKQATHYAESMVKKWAMSEKIGFRVYQDDEFGFSDEIRRKIELEIDTILEESYKRVKNLLSEHKAELDLISNALLLKKTLYGDDVRELIEESLSTASGALLSKKREIEASPNIVVKQTFSKTATGFKNEPREM